MSALIISIIVILLVIFLIIALNAFIGKSRTAIMTSAVDVNIESRLRLIMLKNPGAEIYILSNTDSAEIRDIINRLQKDYPNIHITENTAQT